MKKTYFMNAEYAEGITPVVTDENSELSLIAYDRIMLETQNEVVVEADTKERLLVVVEGKARVELGETGFEMEKYDVLYLPREQAFRVVRHEGEKVSVMAFAAPAEHRYQPQLRRFADTKKSVAGTGACMRENYLMAGPENVQADRLILGYCWGSYGGWTGWPPHDHTDKLEELYVFYDMQEPGFALQLMYDDLGSINTLKVSNGDAVAIAHGYHPLVAVPSCQMKNIWVMAAKRPLVDRRLDLAVTEPEFR